MIIVDGLNGFGRFDRLKPFGTTVFSEMTALAQEHDAINLAQGFPDFEGPAEIVEAAVQALRSGDNQYARSRGHPELVRAIAEVQKRYYGMDYDPMEEVVVFSGATEGIAASMLGIDSKQAAFTRYDEPLDLKKILAMRSG